MQQRQARVKNRRRDWGAEDHLLIDFLRVAWTSAALWSQMGSLRNYDASRDGRLRLPRSKPGLQKTARSTIFAAAPERRWLATSNS